MHHRQAEVYHRDRLYKTSILWLIVELERDNRTFHTVLAGHLGERRNPLKPLALVHVVVVSGGHVVASAVSDGNGDFRLEYDPAGEDALCVHVGDRRPVRLGVD